MGTYDRIEVGVSDFIDENIHLIIQVYKLTQTYIL